MSNEYIPNRGDIIWLVFDPRTGHEQSGRRPALVLSEKLFTERTGLAIVCPITSKVKGLPFEVLLANTKTQGAVLPIYVRSTDVKARKVAFIEHSPLQITKKVAQYVRIMTSAG